jgi:hypothetical protein
MPPQNLHTAARTLICRWHDFEDFFNLFKVSRDDRGRHSSARLADMMDEVRVMHALIDDLSHALATAALPPRRRAKKGSVQDGIT